MNLFFWLLTTIFMGSGMAIILVEKRFEWPIRGISIILRRWLQKNVHRKMHRLLKCSVCSSFWTVLFTDAILCILTGGSYFLWPFSGFAAAAFTWFIYEVLETISTKKQGNEACHFVRDNEEMHNATLADGSSSWTENEWRIYYVGYDAGAQIASRKVGNNE